MAGGFGSRFWPICSPERPKQFLDLLGNGRSMLQSTFKRFEAICPRENIYIVTNELYCNGVREQIKGLRPEQVLCEPSRRNTAPCIAYAASIIAAVNPEANIVVSPSDHAVFNEERFVADIEQALAISEKNDYIVTLGVRPTNPNTKYGYIQFAEEAALPGMDNFHRVVTFTEKPPIEVSRQFIASGEFFWNAGLFVWRLSTLRKAFETYLPAIGRDFFQITARTSSEELERIFSQCETISVDYGIMEKADNVFVQEASFGWSDVESWDTLYNSYPHDPEGNALVSGKVFAYDVKDSVVHLPAGMNVVLQGLDGYVVAGDCKTLLVCRRNREDLIVKFASDVEMAHISADGE